MKYIKAAIAVIALVLLDQWTKVLAVTHLMNTNGVTIIPNVFRLYYLENRGSAFGLMQNQKIFFRGSQGFLDHRLIKITGFSAS